MPLAICNWKYGKQWVYSITYDEALRRATNPDEFKLKIQGIQSSSDMAAEEMEKTMQSFDME